MNASDPHLSAWVAANAGAGKTHTLANRVTRLLLAGRSFTLTLFLCIGPDLTAATRGRRRARE